MAKQIEPKAKKVEPKGKSGPLRLLAQDADDIAIISAAMQDAVAKVGDINYEAKARRLTIAFNRYCWEAGGSERGQVGADMQESGQDQAEGAEDLDQTDEAEEDAWQGELHLFLEDVDRHDELHATGEAEEEGEQDLNEPQSIGHESVLP